MDSCILKIDRLNVGFFVKREHISVVKDLSLEIAPGEVLAIIGETGCGKSVTGSAVLHILPENATATGEIYYKGKEILHLSDSQFRNYQGCEIMSIPQSPVNSLDPLMQAGPQVAECVTRRKDNRLKNDAVLKERILGIFDKLGLTADKKPYEKYSCELSGGMCQRVLISMGMITQAKLMIVDEPTKAIDWSLRKEVIKSLESLKTEQNSAMMVITHDIPFALKIADRVAVMYAGQIVEIGNTDDVLKKSMHPYTEGLIASMPANGFQTMKGFMPSFTDMPKGCRFSSRCRYAGPQCSDKEPMTRVCEKNHEYKCFLSEEEIKERKTMESRGEYFA